MMMRSLKNLPQVTETVQEAVERIFTTRQITSADQQVFLAAMLSERLPSQEEQIQINRVLNALLKGSLKVTE
jgi:uncharacterized protein (DUF924 family)